MTRGQTIGAVVLAALCGLAAGYLAYPDRGAPTTETSALAIGAPEALPGFALTDVEGRRRDSAEWNGKVRVINFWATWCGPCRTEIPHLIAAQMAHGERGLQVVGVAIDTSEAVLEFASELGMNYPLLVGESDAIALGAQLGNDLGALPYTVIADRTGRVVYVKRGVVEPAELDRVVAPLLSDAAVPVEVSSSAVNVQ